MELSSLVRIRDSRHREATSLPDAAAAHHEPARSTTGPERLSLPSPTRAVAAERPRQSDRQIRAARTQHDVYGIDLGPMALERRDARQRGRWCGPITRAPAERAEVHIVDADVRDVAQGVRAGEAAVINDQRERSRDRRDRWRPHRRVRIELQQDVPRAGQSLRGGGIPRRGRARSGAAAGGDARECDECDDQQDVARP
jgi:hypothetical protein